MCPGRWLLDRIVDVVRSRLGEPLGAADRRDPPPAGVGPQRQEVLQGRSLLAAGADAFDGDVLRVGVVEPQVGMRQDDTRPAVASGQLGGKRERCGRLAHPLRTDEQQRVRERVVRGASREPAQHCTVSEDFFERGHRWIVRQTRPVTETDSTLSADVRAPLMGRARSRRDIARVIVFIQAALLAIVGLLYVAGHAEPYVDALSLIGAGILFSGATRIGADAPIYISGRGDEAGPRRVPRAWTDFPMVWAGAFIAAS